MAEQSKTSKDLWLLSSNSDFQEHSVKMLGNCRRKLQILSDILDENIYGQAAVVDAISQLARSGHQVDIQILVRDFRPAIESGHKLLRLAQRLSSKIQLKKMTQFPQDADIAFMICDMSGLVFQNDKTIYKGFANYAAGPEIKSLLDEFIYLWELAEIEKELQILHI
jgi:hypothetical protein